MCAVHTRASYLKKPPPPTQHVLYSSSCAVLDGGWGLFFLVPAAAPGSLGTSTPPQHQPADPCLCFLLSRDRCPSADCCDRSHAQSAQHSVHGYGSLQPIQWTAAENRSRALRYSCSNWSMTMFQPAIDPSGQGIISPDVATSVERSPSGSKMPPVRGRACCFSKRTSPRPQGTCIFF